MQTKATSSAGMAEKSLRETSSGPALGLVLGNWKSGADDPNSSMIDEKATSISSKIQPITQTDFSMCSNYGDRGNGLIHAKMATISART